MPKTASKQGKQALLVLILFSILALAGCTASKDWDWDSRDQPLSELPKHARHFMLEQVELWPDEATQAQILLPYDGTIFPPEIAAPLFKWTDSNPAAIAWLVLVSFDNGHPPLYAYREKQEFVPEKGFWEVIKWNSVLAPATILVHGIDKDGRTVSITGETNISTSRDRVDATILYRQVPLPFAVGIENFKKLKWRLGDVASYDEPPVIMENISTCASCHQASKDGKFISMEMNYKGDSGAQFVTEVREDIALDDEDFMTWTEFPKPELLPRTRGLSAKLSPSGKHMVGTVNEISYAALTNESKFSQVFFPTYGILASYSMASRNFSPLPGAMDTKYVQTDPSWSWDEQTIAFSRASTKNEYHENIWRITTHVEDKTAHELNAEFPIQFDIYTVPFNDGKGGDAIPLKGASHNGRSNYFPRYSPDGRWIVFTQSNSGVMLQPDSELFIVPAKGGTPRKMRCNRAVFNSWHSISPNGKWMVFSSKVNSRYTEIFLTHIDDNGMDSPPVLLSRMSDDGYAANLPEFVNIKPGTIHSIRISNPQ